MARSLSEDHQLIYASDEHIAWTELQVWIGVPPFTRSEIVVFKVAPMFDGSGRATRLLPVGPQNQVGLAWTKHRELEQPAVCEVDMPVLPPAGTKTPHRPMFRT